jgi:phosphate transport system substrate-binding protein
LKKFIGFALLFAAAPSFSSALINGAGASFPYPLYAKWFSEYQKKNPDVQINYQSIGSGGGIRQFTQKTVDFGASDAPMTDAQITDAKEPVVHIPSVLGAVVLTYQVPGLGGQLQLSADVISEIFQGKIARWNDAAIKAINPKLSLPDLAILVAHRSDGSGTTQIFTDYLGKAATAWKPGVGTSVKWPVGLGGKGNEGVAGIIKQTPGSLGYVELAYAISNGLEFASILNKSGAFVAPSLASVTAAATTKIPDDFRVSITDSPSKGAYPISGFTYLLVWKASSDSVKGAKLLGFLRWAVKEGQGYAEGLHYAPLPAALLARVEAKLATMALKK